MRHHSGPHTCTQDSPTRALGLQAGQGRHAGAGGDVASLCVDGPGSRRRPQMAALRRSCGRVGERTRGSRSIPSVRHRYLAAAPPARAAHVPNVGRKSPTNTINRSYFKRRSRRRGRRGSLSGGVSVRQPGSHPLVPQSGPAGREVSGPRPQVVGPSGTPRPARLAAFIKKGKSLPATARL